MSTEYCSIQRAPELKIQFMATVRIPVGFKVNVNPTEEQHKYQDYITIDRNALSVNIVEELRDADIDIPDFKNKGLTTKMACKSKIRVIKLVGPLFYNAIATGFIPLASAQIDDKEGEVIISPATAFSSSGTMEIDFDLGYMCYECLFDPSQITGFKVTLTEGEPFVIAETGVETPYKPENPAEFLAVLDGKAEKVIHYPFTIVLSSEPAPTPTPEPTPEP